MIQFIIGIIVGVMLLFFVQGIVRMVRDEKDRK